MEIGTGIATGTAILSGAAIVMKWLSINSNRNNPQCAAHPFLVEQLREFKEWLIRVEEKIDVAISKRIARDD